MIEVDKNTIKCPIINVHESRKVDELPKTDTMDEIRRELGTRKRILEIYTKDENDFTSKREFDDYLERREDIILSLTDGIDVDSIEAEIAKYKQENQTSIQTHRRRKLEATHDVATASFASSLDKAVTLDRANQDSVETNILRPQPCPIDGSYELTEDGCLKIMKAGNSAAEWLVSARAGGWSREMYYDLMMTKTLRNLFNTQS